MKSQSEMPQFGNENHCTCSVLDCYCGAKVEHEWSWDAVCLSPKLELFKENLAVKFNPGYSTGTAVVRGDHSLKKGRHHYWEVKFLTCLYGTDVMIGVGTAKTSLGSELYLSLLGRDRESWGLSYRGYVQHAGDKRDYFPGFIQGNVIGIHLDTWKGTLQFFVDRKPLGIAFTGLRDLELYPMASSTAAECKMRITYSSSVPASLQMDCLGLLRPLQRTYLSAAFPGLRYISESIFADILQRHNRIAFTGLRDLELYPMASSTAAECKMRITYSSSVPASLQMDCLGLLRPLQRTYLSAAFPGLRYISESIFADILQRHNTEEDDEVDKEFLEMFTILDDFDYALVGCRKKAKRIRLDDDTPAITHWPTPCIKLETLNI